jgi:hypothetical protein
VSVVAAGVAIANADGPEGAIGVPFFSEGLLPDPRTVETSDRALNQKGAPSNVESAVNSHPKTLMAVSRAAFILAEAADCNCAASPLPAATCP